MPQDARGQRALQAFESEVEKVEHRLQQTRLPEVELLSQLRMDLLRAQETLV